MATRPPSPFAPVRPALIAVAVYAVAVVVWLAAGADLPGGRWFAVHLFTLGVLSNAVLAFTQHFTDALLHRPDTPRVVPRMVLFNVGAVAVLAGMPLRLTWLVALGAVAASAAVLWLYASLRGARKSAPSQRFAFLVRTYERATGAFLHGAVLGALLGAGVLPGTWAGSARLAHLHVNVLGWGGLTLLATLVVFGPTVLRTRMQPEAADAAARWLRRGATGLTVAVVALLLGGAGGTTAVVARVVATAGLMVFTAAVVAVCGPVLRSARSSRRRTGLSIAAVCVWFPVAAAADVVIVATGQWRWLPAVGVVLLIGVLGQAILATSLYVTPAVMARSERRNAVRTRAERLPLLRMAALNGAALVIAVSTVAGWSGLARLGWTLLLLALAAHVLLFLVPMSEVQKGEPIA